jgi:hypothetical protein
MSHALAELLGVESPALKLSIAIGQVAHIQHGGGQAGSLLQTIQLLTAASVHATTHAMLAEPAAFSQPSDESRATPVHWLHLAQTLAGLAADSLTPALTQTVCRMIAALYPHLASPCTQILPANWLFLSYGTADLLPIACHIPPGDPARRAGCALGEMIRLAQEARDLFCAPAQGEIPTAPHLLSRIAQKTGVGNGPLRAAWARAALSQPDRDALKQLLGQSAVLHEAKSGMEEFSRALEALPITAGARSCLVEMERECRAQIERAFAAARLFSLLPSSTGPETTRSELDRTIHIAAKALADDLTFREAWEIQRWGDWCEIPRVGRLFPAGLCLLALSAAGQDVSNPVLTLLEQSRRPDGWRYFDDWIGIPPDADDLGLVLQLLQVAACPEDLRNGLAWPVELLLRHTHSDGFIPTWLDKDLIEPPPTSSPEWDGKQCLGVMANAVLGLVQAAWPLPSGYLARALAWMADTYENRPQKGIFYYSVPYVHLLLARIFRRLDSARGNLDARAPLEPILNRIENRLLESPQADGGWGSPQTTACHLELLALRAAREFNPEPSQIYLSGRQGYDGFWPGEPLFRCPGKDRAYHAYKSRSVTTAICLHALLTARTWHDARS